MPVMKVNVSRKLSDNELEALKTELGETLNLVPGKAPEQLILILEEGLAMYMGDDELEVSAYVEAMYCGEFRYKIKNDFVAAIFDAVMKALNMPMDRVFVEINELEGLGGFGDLRDEYLL